ncbi:glycosyltransferase [Faunimonas sp. B44]|uniref:glycosyltransferase n=1 Tax=Faunimonas sp. B44 TaxID=3461493 RepID=UPI004043B9FA
MVRTHDDIGNAFKPAGRDSADPDAGERGAPASGGISAASLNLAARSTVKQLKRLGPRTMMAQPVVQQMLLSLLVLMLPMLERRPFRRPWVQVQRFWLRRTPLFDPAFYRHQYRDIAQSGMSPLLHFIRYGHKEGRSPHLVFNTQHYRNQIASPRERELNPLIHYLLAGGRQRFSPSPWFEPEVYLEHNHDVRRAGVDPFLHFCRYGMRENRKASRWFDPRTYLEQLPAVAGSGISALEHFLRVHGGDGSDVDRLDALWDPPAIPGGIETDYGALLAGLAPRDHAADAILVDVVVPVHRGFQETLSTIYHVLASENATPFRLTVIDDASPEQGLSEALQGLAGEGLFDLLRNEASEGFCASINRGFSVSADRDVVILNADTEVYGDWLDRLRRAAYSDARVATATPMTNNGTIASYPRFCSDNSVPLELSYPALDRIFAEANSGETVVVPTAVGFCTYIRRDALDQIGLFDAETFGRGYGEENDFCLRAQAKGWHDVIACDVFVRHIGGTSFRGERQARVERALKILDRRYPHYRPAVHEFIGRDPLRPVRTRVDHARLLRLCGDNNAILVTHTRGGGTEQNVQNHARALARAGKSVFHLRAAPGSRTEVRLYHSEAQNFPNAGPFFLGDRTGAFSHMLRELRIGEAHVHHLMDFTADAADRFSELFVALGIPYTFMAHDYAAICPRINLVGGDQVYCGEPGLKGCNACLRRNGSEHAVRSIGAWRGSHRRFLENAAEITVPNEDVRERLLRYFPDLSIAVQPHDDVRPAPVRRSAASNRPMRIGVIGAISRIKGYDAIRHAAAYARQRRLPLQFVVVGYTMNDRQMQKLGVEVTGMYHNKAVHDLIEQTDIDLIWLPSLWPETYSYTLSIALSTGLPVAAFDIGAIARRLRKAGTGIILPLSKWDDPAFVCSQFLSVREDAQKVKPSAEALS